jgi:hypothetical protein
MRVRRRLHLALAASLLLAGCGPDSREVSQPFYVTYIENPSDSALFRCPKGPDYGCAIDGLPGPYVFAGGADRRYVVVARHPKTGGAIDWDRTEYFYFARVPQETDGWGNNPEKIIGPLTELDFQQAKATHGLPDFSVDLR